MHFVYNDRFYFRKPTPGGDDVVDPATKRLRIRMPRDAGFAPTPHAPGQAVAGQRPAPAAYAAPADALILISTPAGSDNLFNASIVFPVG